MLFGMRQTGDPPEIIVAGCQHRRHCSHPGVLALLERFLPEANVTLWASGDLTDEVAQMEHRRFPGLRIVKGRILEDGSASTAELQEAVDRSTFLLHGSGPSLVAEKDVDAYVRVTQKPFGVFGITWSDGSPATIELLSKAQFVYFRDSLSLATATKKGVQSSLMEFGPDGAFAADLANDSKADAFLSEHQLQPQKFVCCIPRLRYTPYWLIRKDRTFDESRHMRNEQMKEQDHQPLREAITRIVTETQHKVLICPEDMTQMQVGKDLLWDQLSAEVRKKVVWRSRFWLTDEALSVYRRSAGLFGLEMHSPIMCIGNGIPAIVGRFAEQTTKGIMWKDIGLDEWLFDFDSAEDRQNYPEAVVRMLTEHEEARRTVATARRRVQQLHEAMVQTLRKSVSV